MSTPTGAQVIAYAKSLRGRPRGKVRENVNDFTQWYYGNNTAASWCLIFVCYVFNHFGALKKFLGGKIAYCPNVKHRVGSKWHTSKSGIDQGDPVLFDFNNSGEPEHVGFFDKWLDRSAGRFQSVEGNTGNDVVAVRVRFWRDVYGYVKPGLAPADPSRYPGKIYKLASPMMHDSHVSWIQRRLAAHGHKVTVDGQYGPKTAAAVKAFQNDAHLLVDGEVGPKTWAALAK